MRYASDQQGENEEQWRKKSKHDHKQQLFFVSTCFPASLVVRDTLVAGKAHVKLVVEFISVQHTRIAVAFACWNFLLFLSLKTCK